MSVRAFLSVQTKFCQKILVKKILVNIFFSIKKVLSKNVCFLKYVRQRKLLVQRICDPKHFWSKKCLAKKVSGLKNLGSVNPWGRVDDPPSVPHEKWLKFCFVVSIAN